MSPQPQQPTRSRVRTAAEVYVAAQGAQAAADAPATAVKAVASGATAAGVATAGVLSGFITWLAELRRQHQAFLARRLARYGQAGDIADVIRAEMLLETEFARRAADRLATKLPLAYALSDPKEREAKVRQTLADEERFARMRREAMFARAIAALTRTDLRSSSPLGAFWKLGHAAKHTEGCLRMSGRFWPWAVLDRVHPPRHFGCLLGDTRVWGPTVRNVTRRYYEGQILRVAFRGGCEVGITPNHPVLTRRGWIAADALHVGQEVIGCSIEDLRRRVRDPNKVQVPAMIKHVAGALGEACPVESVRVPVATEDFHGDGREGYVDVVGAGGILRDGLLPAGVQEVREFAFGGGDSATALLSGNGAASEGVVGVRLTSLGGVGCHRAALALAGAQVGVTQSSGRAATAYGRATIAEAAVDRRSGDSAVSGELLNGGAALVALNQRRDRRQLDAKPRPWVDAGRLQMRDQAVMVDAEGGSQGSERLASDVATDEVVSIERCTWAGHVYNLETAEGWYSADGIVVHNCTSSLHGYHDAISAGWMSPGDVQDTRAAVKAAAGVMMEGEADRLLAELDVRDRLEERGVDTAAIPFAGVSEAFEEGKHPRGYHGRFVRAVATALKRGEEAQIEPKHAPALVDELADGEASSLHKLQVTGHPNLFRAHARELRRSEMPQIPKDHLPGFMDFLRSKRVGAMVEEASPGSLRATQNQINGASVAAMAKGWDPARGGMIMVSRDRDVLDGHHRWGAAALHELTHPGYRIQTLRFTATTDRMLSLMREYNAQVGVEGRGFGVGGVPNMRATA